MIEIILIVFFALSVATNVLYIYLMYLDDHGKALPLIRPPVEMLKPWTKSSKVKKPKVNDDNRAFEKESDAN